MASGTPSQSVIQIPLTYLQSICGSLAYTLSLSFKIVSDNNKSSSYDLCNMCDKPSNELAFSRYEGLYVCPRCRGSIPLCRVCGEISSVNSDDSLCDGCLEDGEGNTHPDFDEWLFELKELEKEGWSCDDVFETWDHPDYDNISIEIEQDPLCIKVYVYGDCRKQEADYHETLRETIAAAI